VSEQVSSEFGPPDAGHEVADEPDPAFDEIDEDEDIETPDDGEPEDEDE
jgi:hypothetical protein